MNALRGGRFEPHVDAQRSERALHELDALGARLDVFHSLPLEGCLGFGYVRRQVDRDARAAVVLSRALENLRGQRRQLAHIVVRLARQADDKVQLDPRYAAAARQLSCVHDLLMGEPLVDHVTHALAARLGGQGDGSGAAAHQRFDQKWADAVDPQRRQRHVRANLEHARQQLFELRMIGGGRGDQTDALSEPAALLYRLDQMVDVAVAHRQRGVTRQAEPTAPRAAARHLDQEHVAKLDVRAQHRRHRVEVVHVSGVQARDGQRYLGIGRSDPLDGPVWRVADGVIGRDVHAGQARESGQLIGSATTAEEDLLQACHDRLDLADHNGIEHRGDRLRVAGNGRTTSDDDRISLHAIGRQRGDACST